MNRNYLEALLGQLEVNRHRPEYPFEQHLDALIGVFMPDIITALFGQAPTLVVPEFPLDSVGSRAPNADYLVFLPGDPGSTGDVVLVETRADSRALTSEQIEARIAACRGGWLYLLTSVDASDEIGRELGGRQLAELKRLINPVTGAPRIRLLAIVPASSASKSDQYWRGIRPQSDPFLMKVITWAEVVAHDVRTAWPEEWAMLSAFLVRL